MINCLREQSHWYHTNWFGSKYKVSIRTFCVFCTLLRSKNCSICNIHVAGSLPSNFLISIFGIWWVFNPTLDSMKSWLTFLLFSSWVSFTTFSPLVSISCRKFFKSVFKSAMPVFKLSILASMPFILASTPFILASVSFCQSDVCCTCSCNFDISCSISSSSSWVMLELSGCLLGVSIFFLQVINQW